MLNLSFEVAWAPASIVGLWLVGRGQGEVVLARWILEPGPELRLGDAPISFVRLEGQVGKDEAIAERLEHVAGDEGP